MKILITTNESVANVLKKAGYGFLKEDFKTGELAFARRCGPGEYPRFHAYAKKDKEIIAINLHLDQKRPSYAGTTAHGGEYDGSVLEQECNRIKRVVESLGRQ